MTNRRPAPIDDTALDAVLAPFGAQPHAAAWAAYVDETVLAWEREAFFQGGWVCVGPCHRRRRSGRCHAGRSIGDAGFVSPVIAMGSCTRSRTRAATVGTSCCPATVPSTEARAAPVSRWATSWTAGCPRAAIQADELRAVGDRSAASATRGVGRMAVRQRVGRCAPAARAPGLTHRGARELGVRAGSSWEPRIATSSRPTGRSWSRTTTSATTAR